MKKWLFLVMALTLLPVFSLGCGAAGSRESSAGAAFQQITPQEAQERMKSGSGHVILDVRTRQEFQEGHIPGAICVPNETIGSRPPAELPDKAQTIFVYCRSGRRSKEAARKLADLGYTNVLEFGGIRDWPGEITRR